MAHKAIEEDITKKPLSEIVARMNAAYSRMQDATRMLDSAIVDALEHIPEQAAEHKAGKATTCANPECGRTYIERRAEGACANGYCSIVCYRQANEKPVTA